MAEVMKLPCLVTEGEAAEALGMSIFTLARERKAGRIAFRKMRRGVRYTEADLAAYIESTRVPSCRDTENASASKSETSGLVDVRTAPHGAGRGSIVSHDRLAAHRLAQQTLKPRSSS